jgi:hypothetical protein
VNVCFYFFCRVNTKIKEARGKEKKRITCAKTNVCLEHMSHLDRKEAKMNSILEDMYDYYTMFQAPSKEPTDSLHVGICAPNNNHFYLLIVSIQNQLIN